MTDRRMFRHEVPVDDGNHELGVSGEPVAAAATGGGVAVEFWAEHVEGHAPLRYFRVFGTGQPLPRNARWVATCPRTGAGLVWHLYEMEF
jgi:hypothetical protein